MITGATEQLLGVPKIPKGHGTGRATADAVFGAVQDWNIGSYVKALSFDTTSVNTGTKNGVPVLIEEHIGHELLYLPCRHHIPELILEVVYEIHMGPSNGPEIPLFMRFQVAWPNIKDCAFKSAIDSKEFISALGDELDEIIKFASAQLKVHQPRDDYKELLNLAIMFLGGVPPKGFIFMAPGAYNKTRWMAKAIYAL